MNKFLINKIHKSMLSFESVIQNLYLDVRQQWKKLASLSQSEIF